MLLSLRQYIRSLQFVCNDPNLLIKVIELLQSLKLGPKNEVFLEAQSILYLRLARILAKADDLDDGEDENGLAVTKNKDAALNYLR